MRDPALHELSVNHLYEKVVPPGSTGDIVRTTPAPSETEGVWSEIVGATLSHVAVEFLHAVSFPTLSLALMLIDFEPGSVNFAVCVVVPS